MSEAKRERRSARIKRLLEQLQARPGEQPVAGTPYSEARLGKALKRLRRMSEDDSPRGERARKALAYLTQGGDSRRMVAGMDLDRLQVVVRRLAERAGAAAPGGEREQPSADVVAALGALADTTSRLQGELVATRKRLDDLEES